MKKYFNLIFLLAISGSVFAQQAMSLEECRRLAIDNNKQLKIADEQIKSARAKKEEAFTKFLPGLDVAGTYLRNEKEINLLSENALLPVLNFDPKQQTYTPSYLMNGAQPVLGPDGKPMSQQVALLPKDAMSVDARNVAILQVGITQPVFMGGKVRTYHKLAGLAEKVAESGREQEMQNIIQQTDEAYWQIVSLSNRYKLAEKYLETLKKLEGDVEKTYDVGMATKVDVLSVKVKVNEAEMTLIRVEDGLSLSRMNLNQVCGLPLDTVFRLQEELLNTLPTEVVQPIPMSQVYSNRPEINSLLLASNVYKKKEWLARSEYLPTVALMANYITMTPSFFDGISNKFEGMWSVGVGVKAPIFHWGASRKSVRSARAETNVVNYKLQEAKEKIELQVNQAQFKVKEAAKKFEVAQKNKENAEENLRYANLGFEEGTIPLSNVLEAQTAWLSANSDLIDARIEIKLCEVYLKKAYGTLDIR